MAQVLVQNRVSLAQPVIPDLVQRQGINVNKQSPSTMMIVNLVCGTDPTTRKSIYDDIYLSNYATIQIKDELGRLPGVAAVSYMGERDYSMRAWLDPEQDGHARPEQPTDVVTRHQRTKPSGRGWADRPGAGAQGADVPAHHQYPRPADRPGQFGAIIIKVGQGGIRTDRPSSIGAAARRGPARTGLRSNTTSPARSTVSPRWPCRFISCPGRTRSRRPRGSTTKWRS